MRVEEKRNSRNEVVDIDAGVHALLDVFDAIAERERQLLHRGRSGFADGYPHTEIVFHFGTSFEQNPKMSVMSRIEGLGGKMYSFCAMNSLRMSFWIVPESFFKSAPCFSATTRYIAKIIGAGELIVIDDVISSRAMPSNSRSISASETTDTPHLPTSPSESG